MRVKPVHYLELSTLKKTIGLLEESFYAAVEAEEPIAQLRQCLAAFELETAFPCFDWTLIESALEAVLNKQRTVPNVSYRVAHQILGIPIVRRY